MRALNLELKNELDGRGRAWVALAALAFGCGLVVMAFMSIHYDGRLEAVQKAHEREITTLKRGHRTEKNQTKSEISDRLDRIEKILLNTR